MPASIVRKILHARYAGFSGVAGFGCFGGG